MRLLIYSFYPFRSGMFGSLVVEREETWVLFEEVVLGNGPFERLVDQVHGEGLGRTWFACYYQRNLVQDAGYYHKYVLFQGCVLTNPRL